MTAQFKGIKRMHYRPRPQLPAPIVSCAPGLQAKRSAWNGESSQQLIRWMVKPAARAAAAVALQGCLRCCCSCWRAPLLPPPLPLLQLHVCSRCWGLRATGVSGPINGEPDLGRWARDDSTAQGAGKARRQKYSSTGWVAVATI